MKKIIAAIITTVLVSGAVAPAFAQSFMPNCGFQDKSMCEVKSLLDD